MRALSSVFLVGLLVAYAKPSVALDVPPLTGRVVDLAGILRDEDRATLSNALEQFQQTVGPQMAVLTIPTLEGNPIEDFSIRVADAWKLGDEKRDDGLLLLIAHQDRQVRIEVGQGLEGQIPDAFAGRIIDQVIVPHFRQGNFAGGIFTALQVMAQQLGGRLDITPTAAPVEKVHSASPRDIAIPLAFAVMMIVMMTISGRGRRGGRGIYTGRSSSSWGGFSSSSSSRSSSGGFSGGGGGFSGGGASGRW